MAYTHIRVWWTRARNESFTGPSIDLLRQDEPTRDAEAHHLAFGPARALPSLVS